MTRPIKPKERETIIQSLKSGVVPRLGLQHIQVGRNEELKSFIKDIDTIADGGTSFRFVIGEYGSGKTFFMSLVRSIALEKGLVTVHADLSPSKRLHGSDGQARLLFSELIASMSTRTKQDGNALANILDKFVMQVKADAEASGQTNVEKAIMTSLSELNDYTSGFSFATVVMKYWQGYEAGNDTLKGNALRWLRAEYTTRTDAYRELGVRDIISDNSFYDSLKLYSVLIRKAGYKGEPIQDYQQRFSQGQLRTDSVHDEQHTSGYVPKHRVRHVRYAGIPDGLCEGTVQLRCPEDQALGECVRQAVGTDRL